ncbi:hypothetical protein C8Q74DRAFT_1219419 [Fomes fomentarius]|nr:hypothetical protein C8Q74DRAFT_1219419 [Fomes fomentarius]
MGSGSCSASAPSRPFAAEDEQRTSARIIISGQHEVVDKFIGLCRGISSSLGNLSTLYSNELHLVYVVALSPLSLLVLMLTSPYPPDLYALDLKFGHRHRDLLSHAIQVVHQQLRNKLTGLHSSARPRNVKMHTVYRSGFKADTSYASKILAYRLSSRAAGKKRKVSTTLKPILATLMIARPVDPTDCLHVPSSSRFVSLLTSYTYLDMFATDDRHSREKHNLWLEYVLDIAQRLPSPPSPPSPTRYPSRATLRGVRHKHPSGARPRTAGSAQPQWKSNHKRWKKGKAKRV